jgi:cytoskeletal protein CcmA (bactofilin family)
MAWAYRGMRGDSGSRGSVFLLAMVALITLLLLGTSLVNSAVQALGRASKDRRLQEASNLAESGVDMALVTLYEDYDNIDETLTSAGTYSSSFTRPAGTVSYTVTSPYEGLADTCMIVSEATSWANKRVRVRVIASYQRDVDRVFEGAIFSNSPLTLNGSGAVYPDDSGTGGTIYAKGNITFKGTSFTMDDAGAIYTTGTTNWVPPEVPVTSVYQNIAPIPMPVIDLNYYKTYPGATIYNGDKTFNSSNLSNLSGVIYVNGDVSISGNYTNTNVLIVATGNIKITGDVTAGNPATDSLALLTTKSVKISGTPTIYGLVYSHNVMNDGSATISGNAEIYGAICADVVTANGGITVRYRDVWSGLPIPGKGKTQWAQISWEEHYL